MDTAFTRAMMAVYAGARLTMVFKILTTQVISGALIRWRLILVIRVLFMPQPVAVAFSIRSRLILTTRIPFTPALREAMRFPRALMKVRLGTISTPARLMSLWW